MPYIAQEMRRELDPLIDELALKIKWLADNTDTPYPETPFAGILNYTCTRLALEVLPAKRYWALALMVGVLDTMKSEFYRRFVASYEDEQIEKNGDVY